MQRRGSESNVCEKKAKVRDFGGKRVGVGRRGEMAERPETQRERARNSGRLTFYKTAVLSQVLVLSVSEALFFALVIIWSRGIRNRTE